LVDGWHACLSLQVQKSIGEASTTPRARHRESWHRVTQAGILAGSILIVNSALRLFQRAFANYAEIMSSVHFLPATIRSDYS
jgi:hypothetical protein